MAKTPRDPDAAAHGKPIDTPASYEQALAELERLVAAMEQGQLPLDDMLKSHQRAAELLAFCRGRLTAVESQVKLLEDGQLKDWTAG